MNSIPDSDITELSLDWKKIENNMQKKGWGDGLSDGRDNNLQDSFDKGFADGFKNAFALSKITFQQREEHDSKCSLTDAKKAICIMCTDEKNNDNVADIREKQSKIIEGILDK